MPSRKPRKSDILAAQQVSALLVELRRIYREGLAARRFNYNSIAASAKLNRSTVQRVLAATNCERQNLGRSIFQLEAIAHAMGYKLTPIGFIAEQKPAQGAAPSP